MEVLKEKRKCYKRPEPQPRWDDFRMCSEDVGSPGDFPI